MFASRGFPSVTHGYSNLAPSGPKTRTFLSQKRSSSFGLKAQEPSSSLSSSAPLLLLLAFIPMGLKYLHLIISARERMKSLGWSAYISGLQIDYETFKSEIRQACEHVRALKKAA